MDEKKLNKIIELDLDDFKPRYLNESERWNDWYFVVNFFEDGKEYFLTLTINEGTIMGGSSNRLSFSVDPFTFKKEKYIKIVNEDKNEVTVNNRQELGSLKYSENKESIIIEMAELNVNITKNQLKITSENEKINGNLIFTPRAPVFWWGNKKNEQCIITEDSDIRGIELLCNAKGKINVEGKEYNINGTGLFEHLWMKSLQFLKIRLEDWIYANFDQLSTFLCHVESTNNDGTPKHYETGTIYLIEEDDFLITKKIEFIPENWIYLESAHRFIPYNQKVRVKTDKGTLKIKTKLSLYPQFIGRPRRIEDLTIHGITGWNLMFYDSPMTFTGKFYYKDGKTIKLTNGIGLNNVVRDYPLY